MYRISNGFQSAVRFGGRRPGVGRIFLSGKVIEEIFFEFEPIAYCALIAVVYLEDVRFATAFVKGIEIAFYYRRIDVRIIVVPGCVAFSERAGTAFDAHCFEISVEHVVVIFARTLSPSASFLPSRSTLI